VKKASHRQDRGLVRRRSAHRSKEQNHPRWAKRGSSPARRKISAPPRPISSAPSAQARQGRGARPARLQHLRDESTSCRDRQERRPERACGSRRRPAGWHVTENSISGQHLHCPLPAKCPNYPAENVWQFFATIGYRTASSNHMTISSTIVATHGISSSINLGDHVHRAPRLGAQVLINEKWYKCCRPCGNCIRARFSDSSHAQRRFSRISPRISVCRDAQRRR